MRLEFALSFSIQAFLLNTQAPIHLIRIRVHIQMFSLLSDTRLISKNFSFSVPSFPVFLSPIQDLKKPTYMPQHKRQLWACLPHFCSVHTYTHTQKHQPDRRPETESAVLQHYAASCSEAESWYPLIDTSSLDIPQRFNTLWSSALVCYTPAS